MKGKNRSPILRSVTGGHGLLYILMQTKETKKFFKTATQLEASMLAH